MTDPNRITLYYSPQSRATGTRGVVGGTRGAL